MAVMLILPWRDINSWSAGLITILLGHLSSIEKMIKATYNELVAQAAG